MKKGVQIVIDEMEGKLGGYAALLNYRYLNLCVKAEPVALISITVEDDEGEEKNLEDVAYAMLADKYTYEIIPKSLRMLFPICKAMLKDHPELKQEIITPEEKNILFKNSDEEEKHLLCRVPEVNKDRHDFLMDAVKTLYDQCKVQLDKVKAAYAAKLVTKTSLLPVEEIDEAKSQLEEGQKMYDDMVDTYLKNKQKEIEDAYQAYLAREAEKAAKREEEEKAHGTQVAQQMRMNVNDDEQ